MWGDIVVFICTSLMISDVEHLFVFLSAMRICLWKMLMRVLCPFFNWIIWFLLLICMSSLYILDINSLLDMWFTNIFSHSIGCLFILLMVPLLCRSFLVWCSPMCLFLLLLRLLLMSNAKNNFHDQCQRANHLCFLLGVLWFQVLCSSL